MERRRKRRRRRGQRPGVTSLSPSTPGGVEAQSSPRFVTSTQQMWAHVVPVEGPRQDPRAHTGAFWLPPALALPAPGTRCWWHNEGTRGHGPHSQGKCLAEEGALCRAEPPQQLQVCLGAREGDLGARGAPALSQPRFAATATTSQSQQVPTAPAEPPTHTHLPREDEEGPVPQLLTPWAPVSPSTGQEGRQ